MTNLKKMLSAAAVLSALAAGPLATTPASAHEFEHFHWRYHWGFHSIYRPVWGYGYHFEGYRRVGVVAAPVVCQPGFHLGYEGRFCWPNR